MPRSPRTLKAQPRQARSRETLRRLLDAAERLLVLKHFEDISIQEILRESGVSAGSFYARFRSKEDLLPHLYQEYSASLRARMAAETDPAAWSGLPLAVRIQGLMRRAVAAYRERRGLLRAVALL